MDNAHHLSLSRRSFWTAGLLAAASLSGCALPPQTVVPTHVRDLLAPTGMLRIAVYPGSPTSLVEQAAPEAMRGVSVDLGRALASRLGVTSRVIVYPRVAEVVAALQRGEADFTITNATAERARLVDFASPLVGLELGVLVSVRSRIASLEQMDQPGATIGVSQWSSSERTLGGRLKSAKLRTFASLDAARAALQAGEIDGFATNKGVLFELAERVPGARVLEGRWGTEHLAPAVPKGRESALPFLEGFTRDVARNGELETAVRRAGLRGLAAP